MIRRRHAPAAAILPSIVLALASIACGRANSGHGVVPNSTGRILLFVGRGTSPNDVVALERILTDGRFDYSTATSPQLDDLNESELRAYRLLVVPGGNFEEIGNGLDASTTVRLRSAIGNGLNYLGVCAGAFFAGHSPYNGLNLTSGVRFPFYAAEDRRIRKTAVAVSTPEGPTLDHYWEDGPQLAGWGEVVAKYPDGTPAVAQGRFGDGWVVLTGVHPEAPESWRHGMNFTTPASASHAYAATLVDAAANRRRQPHN
jgi:glutamine amidotransferase-like uncharacterized protein